MLHNKPQLRDPILKAGNRVQKALVHAAEELRGLETALETARKELWATDGHSGMHAVYLINSRLAENIRRAMKDAGLGTVLGQTVIEENQGPLDLVRSLRACGLGKDGNAE